MKRSLYALLVGINEYPSKEHQLNGCINDLNGWDQYLEVRAKSTGYVFRPLVLKNEAATRQAVINGFTDHLSQATADDTVVFFFSGHGSEEPCTSLFEKTSDALNQTLVCWDSRTTSWDLLDKELSNLIALVAKKNPQITIILDCCHSGSGSRDFGERRLLPRDLSPRDGKRIERDICFYLNAKGQPMTYSSKMKDTAVLPPFKVEKGRHILLAACQEKETAKEALEGQTYRGIFSFYMQQVLNQAQKEMTYSNLITSVKKEMDGKVREQLPQLEVIDGDGGERQQFFLSKDRQADCKNIFVLTHHTEGWMVKGGSVNGWPGVENPGVELAVFPFMSTPQEIKKGTGQVAIAKVKKVNANESSVVIEGEALDSDLLYKALLVKAPTPTMSVFLEGEPSKVEALRIALDAVDSTQVDIKEVSDRGKAMLIFVAKAATYQIYRGALLGDPMQAPMAEFDYSVEVVKPLAHIAQWQKLMDLQNPNLGDIPRGALELQLVQDGKTLTGSEVRLAYTFKDGKWQVPGAKLQLINHTDIPLFCSVVDLSSEFSINPTLFPAVTALVEGKRQVDVVNLKFGILPEFLEQGAFEYQDVYKVIASKKDFDALSWQQGYLCDLNKPELPVKSSEKITERRAEVDRDVEQSPQVDWTTCELLVRNIWPDRDDNRMEPAELWDEDEESLLAELALLEARSPIVTERPIELRIERSPIVTERPMAMRSELTVVGTNDRGIVEDSLTRGKQVFAKVSPMVYRLLCNPLGDRDSDLARELTKLMDLKVDEFAKKAVGLLGPVLVQSLGIPQTLALVIATLLIKKAVSSSANLICESWKESLELDS